MHNKLIKAIAIYFAALILSGQSSIAEAKVVFTVDTSNTNLAHYSYCVYPDGFSLQSDGNNNYTITAGSGTSCLPLNTSTNSTISGSISKIPKGSRLYVVAVDANHNSAEVGNPSSSNFGTPLPVKGQYNPPYVALEMTGGSSLDLDLSSIDWFGVPANISVTGYCSPATGTAPNTPYYLKGVCNQIGTPASGVAMSDILAALPSSLSSLKFNLDAQGPNGPYQSIMGIQDYTAQKTVDSFNYLNMGAASSYPLQYWMDGVVAGLFSNSNNTFYIQGAASGAGHSPNVYADIYSCAYASKSIPLYPNNVISVTPGARITSYIQCSNIGSPSVPNSNKPGTQVYNIYDPRQIAYLTYNGNDIRGSWTATNPCAPQSGVEFPCQTATSQTTSWTFGVSSPAQLPIAVPNGGVWKIQSGNWLSGAYGSYVISQVTPDSSGSYISSVTINPQPCNAFVTDQGTGNSGYVCPQPPGSSNVMGMGFFQADPTSLAFGPSISRSIYAGVGSAIDSAYQYPLNSGSGDVLGSLEDQFNEAMNRGVFDTNGNLPTGCQLAYQSGTPQAVTTACFDNNDYWYGSSKNPEGIYNPYAAFIHGAKTSAGDGIFVSQTLYGSAANNVNGNVGSNRLGLAYAFQMDESPIAATLNFNPPSSSSGPYLYQTYATNGQWGSLVDGANILVSLTPWTSSSGSVFNISGSINGLGSSMTLIVSAQQGGDPKVSASGSAQYGISNLPSGNYSLSLSSVPDGYNCNFESSGTSYAAATLGPSSVQNIQCIRSAGYHVAGTISGLDSGKALVLANNAVDVISVANPSVSYPDFEFPNRVSPTSGYVVTVKAQPPGQTCLIASNGSGTATNHKEAKQVGVICSNNPTSYSVGGTVSGLSQDEQLSLTLNGAVQSTAIQGTGGGTIPIPFVLTPELATGEGYVVALASSGAPTGKTCSITNGVGVVQTQDVDNVQILCVDDPSSYKVYGSVSGLQEGNSIVVSDNGKQRIVQWPQNNYLFTGLDTGTSYELSIGGITSSCSFIGPSQPTGVIGTQDVEVNISCTATKGLSLSVQNEGPPPLLLANTQAAVVDLNGGIKSVAVWGGNKSPTLVGTFASGFSYNVQIIGQSNNQGCNYSTLTPGTLTTATNLPFTCGNDPGVVPGVCNGSYANQHVSSVPDATQLCNQGTSSGSIETTDGRFRWRCSGRGNPQVNPLGGTQTCYTLSSSQPAKQNQSALAIAPSGWTITSGGSQTFTILGGAGSGAVSITRIESVGNANCAISTRKSNPGWRISATAASGTRGSGACLVWAVKGGDSNYLSFEAPPAVFNVKPQ